MRLEVVKVLLTAAGRRSLSKEEKAYVNSFNPAYLARLRLATMRRLLGFMNLKKLANLYDVDHYLLKQIVDALFTEEGFPLRKELFFKALSMSPIKELDYYRRQLEPIIPKATNWAMKKHNVSFIKQYDTSLTLMDIKNEVATESLAAVYKKLGLVSTAHLTNLAKTAAKNALVNIITYYTAQKRSRLRKSEAEDRDFEAITVSLDITHHARLMITSFTNPHYDPILLQAAFRRLKKRPHSFTKLKFLQMLSEGLSWDEAIKRSGISEASVKVVEKLLKELANEEGSAKRAPMGKAQTHKTIDFGQAIHSRNTS